MQLTNTNCFDYQQMNELLDPANHPPEGSLVDAGTFHTFVNN